MEIGVFYTCYTEKKAVDYSLEVLYQFYNNVPVYLVSDGGSDYSDIEIKWKTLGFNIKTLLEEDTRSIIPSLAHRDDFYDEDIQNKVFISVMAFLDRTYRAVEYCDREFMLIMEPDVLVRGIISNTYKHKLLGSRINVGMSEEIRKIVNSYPGAIDVNTWGVTPGIFESKSFLRIYDIVKNDENLVRKLCYADRRFANYDFMFAVLFALIGIPETFNPEIVECFRNYNWQNTWHPLVHQFRAKYPLSVEGYKGTHIINKNGMGDTWLWSR
jgi:hypothetical protein